MSDRNLGSQPTRPQSNLPPLTTTQSAVHSGETVSGADPTALGYSAGIESEPDKPRGLNAPRIIGLLALLALVALFVWLLANRGGDDDASTDDATEQVEADAMADEEDGDSTDDAMSDSDGTADDADTADGDGAMADEADEEADAMEEPTEVGSVVDTLLTNSDLSIVADGIGQLGLDNDLSGEGPFTILAPTNDAFFLVTEEEAARLLGDEGSAASVLGYHVLQGNFSAENFVTALEAQGGSLTIDSLTGEEIMVELVGGQVVLNGTSVVVDPDQPATNGVVHTISELLVPPSLASR